MDEKFELQNEFVRRYSLRDALYFAGSAVLPAALTIGGGAVAVYGLLTKNSELAAAGGLVSIAGFTAMTAFGSLEDID